jgi:hypothetical protein
MITGNITIKGGYKMFGGNSTIALISALEYKNKQIHGKFLEIVYPEDPEYFEEEIFDEEETDEEESDEIESEEDESDEIESEEDESEGDEMDEEEIDDENEDKTDGSLLGEDKNRVWVNLIDLEQL